VIAFLYLVVVVVIGNTVHVTALQTQYELSGIGGQVGTVVAVVVGGTYINSQDTSLHTQMKFSGIMGGHVGLVAVVVVV